MSMLSMKSQFFPPSHVMLTPPSHPVSTCFGLDGSIHNAWWSECGTKFWKNVLPPSSETKISTPSTQMRWSSVGSMRTWLKYIGRGLKSLIMRQFAPASSVRYSPVSLPCSIRAYSTLGFFL